MAKKTGPILYPPRIFNVYKPVGMSSTSVVNHFKRNLPKGFGKIGHFGTLDPFADGILLIGVAGACRLNNQIHIDLPKTYRATGVLGVKTPSADIETLNDDNEIDSEVQNKYKLLNIDTFNSLIKEKFTGKYLQTPPSFSATKFEGKALYKWAREGKLVIKEPVEREIFDIKILSIDSCIIEFEATVSTGTYIRTLFEDIAKEIGTLGYLKSLKRNKIGKLTDSSCLALSLWPQSYDNLDDYIMNHSHGIEDILEREKIYLDSNQSIKFLSGNPIEMLGLKDGLEYFVYNEKKDILGFAQAQEGCIKPKVNFLREFLK